MQFCSILGRPAENYSHHLSIVFVVVFCCCFFFFLRKSAQSRCKGKARRAKMCSKEDLGELLVRHNNKNAADKAMMQFRVTHGTSLFYYYYYYYYYYE